MKWRTNGPDSKYNLTELIDIQDSKFELNPYNWKYTGSRFDSNSFIAEREGSFIALIPDSYALINKSISSNLKQDVLYIPNKTILPPYGSPVNVIITFND